MATNMKKVKEVFGFLLAQELAKAAPKDTARLANSFISTLEFTGNGFRFTLPDYARSVIFGAAPHIIVPKDKKALAFKTKDGKTIITRKVNHPGNAPNFFIQDTLTRKGKELLEQAFKIASR